MESVYIADFETRAGEQAIKDDKTWVWGWSLTSIDDFEHVETGSSINTFFGLIRKLDDCVIYFHNLKFDGKFILDFLFKNGFHWVETRKEFYKSRYNFMALIDDSGVFYSITIHGTTQRSKIEIRDSFRKAPFSVEKLGKDFKTKYRKTTLEYELDRPVGYVPDSEELEYMKNDVRVVAEVMKHFYEEGLDKMTISGDSLETFKKMIGHNRFKNYFPQLGSEEDSFVRKSYKGGWCYVDPRRQGDVLTVKGNTYDVNSLYPSMMSSTPYILKGKKQVNIYPKYQGKYFRGKYEYDPDYPLYVCRFKAQFKLKDGYLPTIQIKGGRFADNEYIVDTGNNVEELTLTCIDLELFLEHYELIHEIEYIDGYKYYGIAGIFDEYIDHFMLEKTTQTGSRKAIAKLHLNSLYGKFGQKIKAESKEPYLYNDSKVRYKMMPEKERKPVYIPVATFCTAYARRFTITHAQENYEGFCYADTDSIHMIGDATGLEIHPKNLCCWKHESAWDSAKFLRQKTYMEHIVEEDGESCEPHWIVKCAGMTDNVKERFLSEIKAGTKKVKDFDVGLSYENVKLKPCVVEGGVILKPTPFEIKGRKVKTTY